ncbi:MAG: GNAT family N-acetyltransferase [Actinobacteria bacterium]|nr:GNAT family N-acetyltransferase [Actinomycetota bacterium]
MAPVTVRRSTPADAAAIVRALRRAEGTTYTGQWMYQSEQVARAIAEERIVSWVVPGQSGDVLAHGALRFLAAGHGPGTPGAVEYGMVFTDPEHRGEGLAGRVGAEALHWAKSHRIAEVWMWATTQQPFAQAAAARAGGTEMCLLLAMVPPGANRGFDATIAEPTAALLFVLRLEPAIETGTWYLPASTRRMVATLMAGSPVLVTPLAAATEAADHHRGPDRARQAGSLSADYVSELAFQVLEVVEPSPTCVAEAVRLTFAAAARGCHVTYLDLDPTSAAAMGLAEQFEEVGFAFAGIHPKYPEGRLRYRMQAVTSRLQPRESIAVATERGRTLVDQVWATLPG